MQELLNQVKENLIIEHNEDDRLLGTLIATAVNYAETYQHKCEGFYKTEPIPMTTRQAIIMLASHLYESRDGATAGYFADNTAAAQQVWSTVNSLLRLNKDWRF